MPFHPPVAETKTLACSWGSSDSQMQFNKLGRNLYTVPIAVANRTATRLQNAYRTDSVTALLWKFRGAYKSR